ncbi:MAG: hypothetical protein OEM58_02200 [Nitrospirota bacterium]|nr:hypothetical protein [Nitrospirota bacterium]
MKAENSYLGHSEHPPCQPMSTRRNVENQDHRQGRKPMTKKRRKRSYEGMYFMDFPFKILQVPGHRMVFNLSNSGFSKILNPTHDPVKQAIPKVQIGLKLFC